MSWEGREVSLEVRHLKAEVQGLKQVLARLNQEHDSWCEYRRLLERYAQGELATVAARLETRFSDRRMRVMVRDLIRQMDIDLGAPREGPLGDLRRGVEQRIAHYQSSPQRRR